MPQTPQTTTAQPPEPTLTADMSTQALSGALHRWAMQWCRAAGISPGEGRTVRPTVVRQLSRLARCEPVTRPSGRHVWQVTYLGTPCATRQACAMTVAVPVAPPDSLDDWHALCRLPAELARPGGTPAPSGMGTAPLAPPSEGADAATVRAAIAVAIAQSVLRWAGLPEPDLEAEQEATP